MVNYILVHTSNNEKKNNNNYKHFHILICFLGKVVSTCHWGNLLVWEQGHIQLEVTRKDGSTCHDGQINYIVAEEGELITIGNIFFSKEQKIAVNTI